MTIEAGVSRGAFNKWNVAFWVVQVLLALLYLAAGTAKLTMPIGDLAAAGMGFVTSLPEALTRLIGILEILGAIGIILPAATRIQPWLTPLAAAGLALVQVGAIITHALRGETATTLPLNLVLLALALFVVWGRTKKVQISAR